LTQIPTDPLASQILQMLAAEQAPVSLPRLGKQLGQSGSVLMRQLALMGSASIAGQAGPEWVDLRQEDGRWVARITPHGLEAAALVADAPGAPPVQELV
jgi:FdhD protein